MASKSKTESKESHIDQSASSPVSPGDPSSPTRTELEQKLLAGNVGDKIRNMGKLVANDSITFSHRERE